MGVSYISKLTTISARVGMLLKRISSRFNERLRRELSTVTLVGAPQLKPRPEFSPHHPLLTVSSGFACTACPSRTTSPQVAHKGSKCDDGRAHKHEAASLQCWMQGGSHSRQYWIVNHPSARNGMVALRLQLRPPSILRGLYLVNLHLDHSMLICMSTWWPMLEILYLGRCTHDDLGLNTLGPLDSLSLLGVLRPLRACRPAQSLEC